jgi:hypothetical protein
MINNAKATLKALTLFKVNWKLIPVLNTRTENWKTEKVEVEN